MARTASSNKPALTFAISYGLSGGPLHARQFNRLLREAGYRQARQLAEANIIIAHSGGCSLIPKTAKPRLVIYVGMNLPHKHPSKTWLAAKVLMFKHGRRARNFNTTLKNTYYSFLQPRRNMTMVHRAKTAKPVVFPGCPAVFITNHYDPWPKTSHLQSYIDNYEWAFISLPGAHDHIWEQPADYAAIIDHYARLLG